LASGVLFGLTLAVLIISGVLSVFWLGLPLLIGAAVFIRGIAGFERTRLQ
jgi:hypothetical protein